jgi:hypothetical protein
MEQPQYAEINELEIREIEAEFGHPVTREVAQWFIRNRINRVAVERMLGIMESNETAVRSGAERLSKMRRPKVRKQISAPKKRCA